MTPTDLLLTDERSGQLTAALANVGVEDPLQMCIDEAEAEVARYTTGYTLEEASVASLVRDLALGKAYALCGPMPADIKTRYDNARDELIAISKGERPNLAPADTSGTGSWGSRDKIL